jgi:hypothetical protein
MNPAGVACDGANVWVTSYGDGVVRKIAPAMGPSSARSRRDEPDRHRIRRHRHVDHELDDDTDAASC